MQEKDKFEESRRHLALEVLITLAETASGMVRKVAKKYLNRLGKNSQENKNILFQNLFLVPQLLEMMVDLDDDAEWSTKDTIEDEEDDSNAVVGESSLDRLSCALGGKTVLTYILTTVQTMLQNRKLFCFLQIFRITFSFSS
jgi:hypothetical protein